MIRSSEESVAEAEPLGATGVVAAGALLGALGLDARPAIGGETGASVAATVAAGNAAAGAAADRGKPGAELLGDSGALAAPCASLVDAIGPACFRHEKQRQASTARAGICLMRHEERFIIPSKTTF